MAATQLALPYSLKQPRTSSETDRRHLLADSVAPSETSSIITDGDRTPRAHSPAPSTDTQRRFRIPANTERRGTIADPTTTPNQQPYKGFPSEAHYLAALSAWADSKKYVEPTEMSLHGFYGHTTMQEIAARPGQDFGIKRKWREIKEARGARREGRKGDGNTSDRARLGERRNTVA
jgi:hypothetical protein